MKDNLKVTLVIATLNRSPFLVRLLEYYRDTGFSGTILIGDSSGPEHQDRTKAHLERLGNALDVRHVDLPGLGSTAAYEELSRMVDTPYAALSGDDDFLVSPGLGRCAEFLDGNPGYASATGKGLIFRNAGGSLHGEIESLGYYPTPDLSDGSACGRLLRHFQNYSVTLFSVHRTESWRAMWGNASNIKNRSFGSELLPCCLSATLGRVKRLDRLYLVRQGHDQRYVEAGVYDWISGENWRASYLAFEQQIAESLAEQDGISREKAGEVVKQAFWSYLAHQMQRQWNNRYGGEAVGLGRRSRNLARRVPTLQRAWRELRSVLPGEGNRMSLKALLRPSSPYHEDFMPVYRAITTPPSE